MQKGNLLLKNSNISRYQDKTQDTSHHILTTQLMRANWIRPS